MLNRAANGFRQTMKNASYVLSVTGVSYFIDIAFNATSKFVGTAVYRVLHPEQAFNYRSDDSRDANNLALIYAGFVGFGAAVSLYLRQYRMRGLEKTYLIGVVLGPLMLRFGRELITTPPATTSEVEAMCWGTALTSAGAYLVLAVGHRYRMLDFLCRSQPSLERMAVIVIDPISRDHHVLGFFAHLEVKADNEEALPGMAPAVRR